MVEIILAQADAEALMGMEKVKVDDKRWEYPEVGGHISIPLTSRNKRENFSLDIRRGRIDLLKGTHQNRAYQVVILLRLDFGGPPHRNPDGQEIPSPHMHFYREGFGDKWAAPAPLDKFTDISDIWLTLGTFMKLCNITDPPNIERGLFV